MLHPDNTMGTRPDWTAPLVESLLRREALKSASSEMYEWYLGLIEEVRHDLDGCPCMLQDLRFLGSDGAVGDVLKCNSRLCKACELPEV